MRQSLGKGLEVVKSGLAERPAQVLLLRDHYVLETRFGFSCLT